MWHTDCVWSFAFACAANQIDSIALNRIKKNNLNILFKLKLNCVKRKENSRRFFLFIKSEDKNKLKPKTKTKQATVICHDTASVMRSHNFSRYFFFFVRLQLKHHKWKWNYFWKNPVLISILWMNQQQILLWLRCIYKLEFIFFLFDRIK